MLRVMIVIGAVGVLLALVLPALMRAPSKYARVATPPGIPTVLRQVQWASAEYGLREGKAPTSLADLEGIIVLTSKGEKMPFSIPALEQELGTNASAIHFFPEFRALDFGAVPGDEIVLAYVAERKKPEVCQVILRSGRMQRVPAGELQKQIEQLRSLLSEAARTNTTPK